VLKRVRVERVLWAWAGGVPVVLSWTGPDNRWVKALAVTAKKAVAEAVYTAQYHRVLAAKLTAQHKLRHAQLSRSCSRA
jgi:hypothetical protein